MDFSLAEKIVHSVIQILTLDQNKTVIGTATGFMVGFCQTEDNSYVPTLVTNRHVLDNCPYISVVFTLSTPEHTPDIGKTISATIDTSEAIFHPDNNIDLAILPLTPTINALYDQGTPVHYAYLQLDLIPTAEDWQNFDAIENVIMAGFPKGMRDTVNNQPIARRGITATHPALDYQGEPKFLVDMPCFKGCSGSPVFILNEGTYYNKRTQKITLGSRVFLLGIQHAIPDIKDIGELEIRPSSNASIKPVVPLHLNLGFIIKSTALFDFEAILRSKLGY